RVPHAGGNFRRGPQASAAPAPALPRHQRGPCGHSPHLSPPSGRLWSGWGPSGEAQAVSVRHRATAPGSPAETPNLVEADSKQRMKSWADYRSEFPVFKDATYLNSCSLGALGTPVRRAIERCLDLWSSMGASAWYGPWWDELGALRASVARLLGAGEEDRSEERRVGKEWRARRCAESERKMRCT